MTSATARPVQYGARHPAPDELRRDRDREAAAGHRRGAVEALERRPAARRAGIVGARDESGAAPDPGEEPGPAREPRVRRRQREPVARGAASKRERRRPAAHPSGRMRDRRGSARRGG